MIECCLTKIVKRHLLLALLCSLYTELLIQISKKDLSGFALPCTVLPPKIGPPFSTSASSMLMQKWEIQRWADSGIHRQWEHPGEPWWKVWPHGAVRSQSPPDLFCASCGQCCNSSKHSMLRAWQVMVLSQCLLLFLVVLQAQDTQSAPVQGQGAGRQAVPGPKLAAGPGLGLSEPERLHSGANTPRGGGGGCSYFEGNEGFLTSREVGPETW